MRPQVSLRITVVLGTVLAAGVLGDASAWGQQAPASQPPPHMSQGDIDLANKAGIAGGTHPLLPPGMPPRAAGTGRVTSNYSYYQPGQALHDENDQLVATVEGHNIYLSDIGDAYRALPDGQRQRPFDMIYPLLLETAVNQSAVLLEAQKLNLDDDRDVKRRMAHAADMALSNEFLTQVISKKVTDETVRALYEKRYVGQPDVQEARLRVIFLRSAAEADSVLADLAKGGDFAAIARARSIDPSAVRGGDVGYVRRGQLSPAVADEVFALAVAGVSSKPIQDGSSWEIFKVEDRRTAPVPTFDQARAELQHELTQQVIKETVQHARSTADIHMYNLNGTPFQPPSQDLMDFPLSFETHSQPN